MLENDTSQHGHVEVETRFAVIPTAEKLNADSNFTGKGITIAFLDSGFYPHPDFVARIKYFHDISGEEKILRSGVTPKNYSWHGTQTVSVCAGDGSLSGGIYRGLAFDADLVLVKVSRKGRISDTSIEKGLLWIIANREKYNIRVLNMSLGGDIDRKSADSRIDRLAGELVASGVVVTVAAGNTDQNHSIPPANAPSVITVGGYSDENEQSKEAFRLYHSNFGKTADGIQKPEIIAPAMYVAAPILPQTEDYRNAEYLSLIASSPDDLFSATLSKNCKAAGLADDIFTLDPGEARDVIEYQLYSRKIVATHYQHVDGTSFAAPITASVIAQMLEANPSITPEIVKNILVSTAERLPGFEASRQGFGLLNAGKAVAEAMTEIHRHIDAGPHIENEKIVFVYHDDEAKGVYLAGDFNDWRNDEIVFHKTPEGLWRAEIKDISVGKHLYKLIVDGIWKEDPVNNLKEDDGFGGFNSILGFESRL